MEREQNTNYSYKDILDQIREVTVDPRAKAKKIGLSSSRFSYDTMGQSANEVIYDAKKRDRSYTKPENWGKSNYHRTNCCQLLLENCPDEIDRIDYLKMDEDYFVEHYESKNKPCIITNTTGNFNVEKYWTFQNIYNRYKDIAFKIGEDDKGKKIRVKLKYFFEYLIHNTDDSPLYMFESAIESIKEAKKMIDTYEVPKYFKEDLFQYIGEKKRPPYRWFLIGPQRSGTTVHIDPLYTSAWNTSLQGYKRWVLFDPNVPKSVVKAKKFVPQGEDDDAIQYFCKMLPKLVQEEGRENLGIIEFIQRPGETVFIPGGWWHAVINVTDTVAVTQNYMNSVNIPMVWPSFRKERKKLASYTLKKYQKKIPHIHKRLVKLNEKDGFIMYDQKKQLKKKIFAEDDLMASKEKRKPFGISEKKPIHLSSDETSNSSSSSSSSSYSSSSQSSSDSGRDKRSRSRSRDRNKSNKTKHSTSRHHRNHSNSETTSR